MNLKPSITEPARVSPEFKRFFAQHAQRWQQKHRLQLNDLAYRCGVTPSYMSQVSAHGRIPGKPVLILLALQFNLEDPALIFRVAGVSEEWPFDRRVHLAEGDAEAPGFLQVKLDMNGLAAEIAKVINRDARPRSVIELTRGRPLRVGLNENQSFFVSKKSNGNYEGIIPELLRLVSLSLRVPITFQQVSYREATDALGRGEIDIYCPLFQTPERLSRTLMSDPFAQVALSALWRKQATTSLRLLARPKTLRELRDGGYVISVLADSSAQSFVTTSLSRDESQIVVSASPEEALERITMTAVPRPAHLMVCDSVIAKPLAQKLGADVVDLLFATADKPLTFLDNCFAIRHDWPELHLAVNDSLHFLARSGASQQLVEKLCPPELSGLVRGVGV